MFSDWFAYFWPQILDPWSVYPGVFNLPWLFVALQPLRLLGPYGAVVLAECALLFAVIKLSLELRLSFIRMCLVILSPPVVWGLFLGQIDGLIMLAYLLPPLAALSLTLAKPQTSLGAAVDAVFERPWILLAGVALIGSAWLIWNWPFSTQGDQIGPSLWNWSCWPWGLLLVPLLFVKDRRWKMLASPFVIPYTGVQSLIGPMLAVATLHPMIFGLVWIASWLRWAFMLRLLP